MTSSLPPFLIFFIAAAVIVVLPARLRGPLTLAVPVIGVLNLMAIPDGSWFDVELLGYHLVLVRMDQLSFLFGLLFHIAAFIGFIFALHVDDRVQQVASILYPGSALGAVFAGDMATLFVFWELLALTSVFLILARRTERAYRASMRYLLLQVTSGLFLLAGAIIWVGETGSIEFGFIGLAGLSSWLIFIAMGIKCGFPFMHTWATDCYPEATPTGTVFLSSFTTKVGVYALARAFPGTELLVYIGATMTMFPIFFAVIENDLRRVLAYSMINQIGFMVCGIGIGTALAVNGAVSHAFNDVIFKGLLFMSMGAVLYRTGKIDGSALGGLYKSMPKTAALCIVGAASISAFPLFSGFVSKSMVMVAALEEGHWIVWLALLFASAGVFHHAGIKIPFFAFFAHDSGIRVKEAPANMLVAMAIAAGLCIFIGVYPWLLYGLLPYPVDYEPYTVDHVLTQCQLLFFSALAFTWLKLTGLYPPELPSVNLDVDWLYRRAMPAVAMAALRIVTDIRDAARTLGLGAVGGIGRYVYRHHGPHGVLARTWPTGSMAFWATLLLAAWLVIYYVR